MLALKTDREKRQGTSRTESNVQTEFSAGSSIPEPESRLRRFAVHGVALIALVISCAYLSWRARYTLGDNLWISVPLWLLELSAVGSLALFCFSLWDVDSAPVPVKVRRTSLRIAVLIPTFNEPREVLLPTVAAATSLAPDHETWVLDDGRRTWVKELAESLGARYLAREDTLHAKAGNLNNAIAKLDVDIVGVLDADHVANAGFLTNTLAYFDDPKVAVVQTPQDFYNVESFEHGKNRSWLWRQRRREAFSEQRLFYRAIQPGKNRWHAAFWCGTNALVRLSALREIGGVAEETVTEDMHTTIRLHRRGWHTVYHNEVLAYGLAARNASEYQAQRTRWGTGAMQILRLEHPLTGRGLSMTQRLAYASTILGWFDAWRSLGYVLLPLVVLTSGANPIHAPALLFVMVFGVTFASQRLALAMLSRGYAPQGMAVLFEFVRMQSNIRATLAYLHRGERAFRVTAKQSSEARKRIHPPVLLLALIVATAIAGIWFGLTLAGLTSLTYHVRWVVYGAAAWAAFNGVILVLAVLRIHSDRFATERRAAVRVRIGTPVELDDRPGHLVDISVGGALIRSAEVPDSSLVEHILWLHLGDNDIALAAHVCSSHVFGDDGVLVMLRFAEGQDREIARLTTSLFGGVNLEGSRNAATTPVAA